MPARHLWLCPVVSQHLRSGCRRDGASRLIVELRPLAGAVSGGLGYGLIGEEIYGCAIWSVVFGISALAGKLTSGKAESSTTAS
jgi:hypothetical protein